MFDCFQIRYFPPGLPRDGILIGFIAFDSIRLLHKVSMLEDWSELLSSHPQTDVALLQAFQGHFVGLCEDLNQSPAELRAELVRHVEMGDGNLQVQGPISISSMPSL